MNAVTNNSKYDFFCFAVSFSVNKISSSNRVYAAKKLIRKRNSYFSLFEPTLFG